GSREYVKLSVGSRWYCRHQHAISRYFRLPAPHAGKLGLAVLRRVKPGSRRSATWSRRVAGSVTTKGREHPPPALACCLHSRRSGKRVAAAEWLIIQSLLFFRSSRYAGKPATLDSQGHGMTHRQGRRRHVAPTARCIT